ncbi:MAG: succinylglutamate desuccinylase/aspartoacylase family protein [bacterium]
MRRAVLPVALLLAAQSARAQDARPTFSVGTATAARGTSAMGAIVVPAGSDSGLRMPVAVIHGGKPGPVVAFVAGAHGTEYASIIALQRLIPRIDAKRLSGTVIIAPLLNVASFETMTPHVNPVDKKGMNGVYPGDSAGTQSQRALALVTREIVVPSDYVVDLHGGDIDEDLRPYSYWFRGGRPAQDSVSRALVMAFGLDHVFVTDVNPTAPNAGRTLSTQALVRGKPVVVAEAGRSGVVTNEDVTLLIDGSLNVLGALKMIDRVPHPAKHTTWLGSAGKVGGNWSARVAADSAGVFIATARRDQRVKKGDTVGYTTDYLGRRTAEITSPIDGLITFIRGVPSMWPKATLVNVAPILSAPPAWIAP